MFCTTAYFRVTLPSFSNTTKMTPQSTLATFIAELRRRRVFRVAAFYGVFPEDFVPVYTQP